MKTTATESLLQIENVSIDINGKSFLRNISALAKSGEILAVMGPSGSGKTTLLNTIAGRHTLKKGKITLNGVKFGKQLRRRLGFVLQNDIFLSRLSLRDTLYFTAMISLSESIPHADKLRRIDEIVDALDIRKCLNTVIGDSFIRGLSGGERKRASIACELLSDPDILLLDEPTSGLDSSTAWSLMYQMKNLAVDFNKTIIITIHQPSSQIYHMFDALLLLVKGQVAYYGRAHRQPIEEFAELGFVCSPRYNPADFFLEVLTSDDSTVNTILEAAILKQRTKADSKILLSVCDDDDSGIDSSASSRTTSRLSIASFKSIDMDGSFVQFEPGEDSGLGDRKRWPTRFVTQLMMLIWRDFKQTRGRILHPFDACEVCFISIILSLMYFQVPKEIERRRDVMGCIFYLVAFWAIKGIGESSMVFHTERSVVAKERAIGSYRLSAYYIAKVISEVPLVLILPTFMVTLVFWMAGLGDVRQYFITLGIICLNSLVATSIGSFIGALIKDTTYSYLNAYMLAIISTVLAGFFSKTYPWWFTWSRYVSVIHYCYGALSTVLLTNLTPQPCNETSRADFPQCYDNSTDFITYKDVLIEGKITLPVFCYLSTMAIITCLMRVLGYFALRWRQPVPR